MASLSAACRAGRANVSSKEARASGRAVVIGRASRVVGVGSSDPKRERGIAGGQARQRQGSAAAADEGDDLTARGGLQALFTRTRWHPLSAAAPLAAPAAGRPASPSPPPGPR